VAHGRRSLIGAAALVAGAALGCTPGAPPPPSAPRASTALASPEADLSGAIGERRSAQTGLVVPLPDARGWRVGESAGGLFVARHAASSSELTVGVWREADRVSRDRCEALARERVRAPSLEGAIVLEEQVVPLPAGMDTRFVSALAPPAPGAPVRGFVTAFGGWARRCFLYVFTTSARGDDAPRVVGVRLATMTQASLLRVKLESDLDPAITHETGR
jgi:hypothetical protein